VESAFRSSAESTKCHGEEIIQSRDLLTFRGELVKIPVASLIFQKSFSHKVKAT